MTSRSRISNRGFLSAVALSTGILLAPAALAQPIGEALFSPDISVTIGVVPFDDEDVAFEDFSTPISPFPAPPLASNVDLSAYHVDVLGTGHVYFVVDTTTQVAGPLTIDPRKIVQWDSSIFTVVFDTATLGVPAGTRIDALSVHPASGDYVVSFDTTVTIGPTTFHDEDLVRLSAGSASLHLDGSAAGLSTALDVDGAALLLTGDWITITLDTSGAVGGVAFDDEDILLHHPTIGSWYMAYDASAWASEMEGAPTRMPSSCRSRRYRCCSSPTSRSSPGSAPGARDALRDRRGFAVAAAALAVATSASPYNAYAADGVIEIYQAAITSFPYVIHARSLLPDLSTSNCLAPE